MLIRYAVRGQIVLLFVIILISCNQRTTLFTLVPSSQSGIHFINRIQENDSINPIDLTNVYNGGGVGVGDFNNDGLQDLYFTGNLVSNKLYLNKGNLQFDDVTTAAGVGGKGEWCRGVSVIDINNDGWLDMYVSASILNDAGKRQNLLYINTGLNDKGIPSFKEMAAEYGLNDTTHTTMAAFFDYDNDGDLDVYLCVNEIRNNINPSIFRPKITDGSFYSTGRLYRNDWDTLLKHPVYTNVTSQAGVTMEGYGHAVSIADFNRDGWKDIFVTNDFLSNDLLYINNHDGTFSDKAATYFKHTSANGMGQEVIDVNNDGLSDIVELDMNPEDNYRKKMMMGPNSYQTYLNSDHYGYQYQYVRNTLQLNQGPRVGDNDTIGDPVFSDIGFFSGMAETDWSWTPLVEDFDNDGNRDILITNGFPRDVTDHDFIAFRNESFTVASKDYTLSQIPQVKLHNYAFHNKGNLRFENVTSPWGLTIPSFSSGAVYADLDNDGDQELVINNINDEAFLYKNNTIKAKHSKDDNHFLTVRLRGDSLNKNGLGAWVEIYAKGLHLSYEQTPYRGYLSSVPMDPHFGLGKISTLDSVVVKWPDGKKQSISGVGADSTIVVDIKNANEAYTWDRPAITTQSLFTDITKKAGLSYTHHETDFIDFNIQKLLPHKFSQYGPALAAGDIDGNGLEDIISGGSFHESAQIFLQQENGKFLQRSLLNADSLAGKISQDTGILLFDADGDNDLDLYIASGGYDLKPDSSSYQDRFYINNGKGEFMLSQSSVPINHTSKFCVRAADYDRDGDLDLFVAGRVEPWNYPNPVSSFLFRNDTKNGKVVFKDVTATVAKDLINAGMICDAVFSDYDNDGWADLIIAGEWMPVTILHNDHGIYKNATQASGISSQTGWWNSIAPGDFDNDGDMDYIIGNLGENSYYRASEQYPARIYAKDFDNNGSFDAIPTLYLPDKDGKMKEFPAQTRDDLVRQMTMIKLRFVNYKSFALAGIDKILTPGEKKNALVLQAVNFTTSLLRNDGNGKFSLVALPAQMQFSAIGGMSVADFDGDGNADVVVNGNDYGTEPSIGRYDAMNGLFLRGNGKGGFLPEPILQSGIFIPGNGKALSKICGANGKCLLVASQNRGPIKLFELRRNVRAIPLRPYDASALITYRDGHVQKMECPYGSSFLSQGGRFINAGNEVSGITVMDFMGVSRKIALP